MLRGLYTLTDNQVVPYSQWPNRVEEIIIGGANIIQLRDKKLTDEVLLDYAVTILEICRYYNIPLIINDRIELAKKINADGVHIGKNDLSLRAARKYLGNKFIIGISCYRNLYTAIQAQNFGADYVAFGSIFPSSTKPHASRCSLATLVEARKILQIPICAIGGLRYQNIQPVIATGVDLVAIGDAIFNAKHPLQATTKLSQTYIMQNLPLAVG